MSPIFDFVVVGGGLVGASLARGLARHDQKVCVLDEGDVAHRASRGNFALVWLQSKGINMPAYSNWTRRSIELWPAYADDLQNETDIDVNLQQDGGLHLALSDVEMERLIAVSERINRQPGIVNPYPYKVLDGTEVRKMLPAAGPEVVGGTYSPLDGHVNALRLYRAMHRALVVGGVAYRPGSKVRKIGHAGHFTLSIEGGDDVHAKRIVLAAGLDNARLAPMVGLSAPVRPQRGNIIVTEKVAPFLDLPVQTVRQTDEGSVMIGDSQEEAGLSDGINSGIMGVMADRAIRMFPAIAGLNIVRMWACLRVLSPDGFPIYDESGTHPGAFVATCHSGVTLAAAHAALLAPHLARDTLPEETRAFQAGRFNVPKAA